MQTGAMLGRDLHTPPFEGLILDCLALSQFLITVSQLFITVAIRPGIISTWFWPRKVPYGIPTPRVTDLGTPITLFQLLLFSLQVSVSMTFDISLKKYNKNPLIPNYIMILKKLYYCSMRVKKHFQIYMYH